MTEEQTAIFKILEETQTAMGGTDRSYLQLLKQLTKEKKLHFGNRPLIGQMLFFKYEPINEKFLNTPNTYYDIFPLCIITDVTRDGFEGINLHYLDLEKRQFLLSSLLEGYTVIKSNDTSRNRLLVSYQSLKNRRKMRFFKPCYKKYRWKGIKRRPIEVPFEYWQVLSNLDLGFFTNKVKPSVYRHTNTKITRNSL